MSQALKREEISGAHLATARIEVSVAKAKLGFLGQQYEDTIADFEAAKEELASLKKKLSDKTTEADSSHAALSAALTEIANLKKELGDAKDEAAKEQQAARSANMEAIQANQQRARAESAYKDALTSFAGSQAEHESTQMSLGRTSEELCAMRKEFISTKAVAAASSEELSMQKKSNTALASELADAQARIANVTSELDTTKIELAAFRKPDVSVAKVPASTQGGSSLAPSTDEKMAAWGNAQNIIRGSDLETRRANEAKAEAAKDRPQGAFIETFRARGETKRKPTKLDAMGSLMSGLKVDMEAKDAEISSLKSTLGGARKELVAEKAARVSCEKEIAVVRSALGTTQNLVKDVRSQLAAAETAKTELARVGCSCSTELRIARAAEAAALEQIDKLHFKCMETWSVFHDITCGVEAAARSDLPLGAPGPVPASSSDDDDESSDFEVTFAGTDGVTPLREEKEEDEEDEEVVEEEKEEKVWAWDPYTPPHMRRAGLAKMVEVVKKKVGEEGEKKGEKKEEKQEEKKKKKEENQVWDMYTPPHLRKPGLAKR